MMTRSASDSSLYTTAIRLPVDVVTQFPLARRAERSQRRDDADVRGIVGQAWWPKPIAH